ncbi:MAG: DUF4825 domain-containing protein [Bacilli bacterium]
MKKFNSYIPLWLLLILPPIIILTLMYGFLMSGVAIFLGAVALKITNPFDDYFKNVLKLFFITIFGDFLCAFLFLAPEFLYKIKIIKTNIITPLEYNPYKNIFSFIYVLLIALIIGYTLYRLISKIILKKQSKIFVNVIMLLFIFPYLFFVPSTFLLEKNKSNLDDFRGTLAQDKSNIVSILNNLNLSKNINSYVLETKKEPYTLQIFLDNQVESYQKKFEIDAATIFMLVKNVNEIVYHMEDSTYTYDINKINSIFGDVKNKNLNDLKKRYTTTYFKNKIYLGRIKNYDVFDVSEMCEDEPQLIYEEKEIHYYLNCTRAEDIILIDSTNNKINIKKAFSNNLINVDNLLSSDLNIIVTGKEEKDENISK